eukprot:TRINITY_DN15558_c1_g1_i1.p1 TRINITY_DN15558_c1_g1~~TRINITY_DN15558_c1_g1_i1.p1  ORF type:complete len:198 (-),score=41.10 TRINITY_DN15558_c1_g1_i1:75-668(-)
MVSFSSSRARRSSKAPLASLIVICMVSAVCVSTFVSPLLPIKRGSRLVRHAAKPSEEAIRTRGAFMSLDSEEFGLDFEKLAAEEAKALEEDESLFKKIGDAVSSKYILIPTTLLIIWLTWRVFYTEEAEDSFYYGAVRERVRNQGRSVDETDFRNFDKSVIEGVKKMIQERAEAAAQKEAEEQANQPSSQDVGYEMD